jgi:hypothetical protein
MALDTNLAGGVSGSKQEVDANKNAFVITPGYTAGGVSFGGGPDAGQTLQSENDSGVLTGVRHVHAPETDDDYRLRVGLDLLMDQEAFTDTAQNTGKFSHAFTTLTATSSASGLLTNSGNITTTTTGMTFGSFAQFPVGGTNTLVVETALSFSAQPNSNTVIDFGVFQRGASTAFAPLDGVYFRMNSTGLSGVINNAGVETTTGVFPLSLGTGTFAYTNNRVYRFLIQITNVVTTFWIDNLKVGEIPTPAGADSPCQSRSLPWSIRHAIVGGAAGAATQALVKDYRVTVRGPQYANVLSTSGNRMYGSYQGLSGGTMGSLATYANSTNPTAAAPSNTALTANLPAGLGGQGSVTAAAAAATDGIWGSYQVPAGSTTVQGRRLVVRGVRLQCINTGAAVATTATVVQFSLAFGHTAVSMATAESGSFATGTAKAPRRVAMGFQSWAVGAAIGAPAADGPIYLDLGDAPIYVNPGEFIALVGKFLVGTATASQTIAFIWQPVYGWE